MGTGEGKLQPEGVNKPNRHILGSGPGGIYLSKILDAVCLHVRSVGCIVWAEKPVDAMKNDFSVVRTSGRCSKKLHIQS